MRSGMKKDFLAITDFAPVRVAAVLERARAIKAGSDVGRPLANKQLGLIFHKRSTRTRVSFEVGIRHLGGESIDLYGENTHMGHGESVPDTARVLSRYLDGLMIRTHEHQMLQEFATWSSIPVINGLTDWLHPCQVMADVMTALEALDCAPADLDVAWVGDGNNMANSWLNAARSLGFRLRLACPEGYEPDAALLAAAQAAAEVLLVRDPAEAVSGAQVVTTDVWTSMGHEAEQEQRMRDFAGYRVDSSLMDHAHAEAVFLHCLPAHRGEEVTAEVLEGPRSLIWDEAENRLHVQKSILVELFE